MTIHELIAALEKAEGPKLPDNLLGRAICAAQGWKFGSAYIATGDDGSDEYQLDTEKGGPFFAAYRDRCPDVSLDACAALQAAVLPGWFWQVSGGGDGTGTPSAAVQPPDLAGGFEAEHKHPCIAWLISIMRAVEAGK